ncbi:hypothetical protein [Nocardia carnea]|uniref:hypothetical protein n=1 Tax=Nocardia carnea TaxID=37328 RepID=UPI0024570AD8|nr:hypothetical protein [Nocardia carnea]
MTDRYGEVVILADHSVLLAIPAFLPAFIIAGVVLVIAVRDRRGDDEPPERGESGADLDEES